MSQDVKFERIQLSDQFYSEGGTHGDYNNDGEGDVAIGPWIYWGPTFQTKARFYPGDAIDPLGYSENFLMYSDDVNGDGRLDILVLGFPGRESWWYENPGNHKAIASDFSSQWPQHVILASVDNESPMIVDINSDSVKDLICSSGGKYLFASHAGRESKKPWKTTDISTNNGYHRFTHGIGAGDVDNDGNTDLLEKNGWWKNPGTKPKSTWEFNEFSFSDTGGAQMYAVDFDGDGKNEVLTSLVAHGFGLAYYKPLNAESTQFERVDIMTDNAATSPAGIAVGQLHAISLADMNNDGIDDIVTGKRWWAHANKDAGNSEPATLLWLETRRGAGRVDFVPHVVDISSGVGTQITTGDVNGDGLIDIVSGNKRGGYVFLQRPSLSSDRDYLVPTYANTDPFGQLPATDFINSDGKLLPAMGERILNFGFENGDLQDWEARGPIATGSLIENDDDEPRQAGNMSINTNVASKRGIGEFISRPFTIRGNSASCLIGGMTDELTRFELVAENSGQVLVSSKGSGTAKLVRTQFDTSEWNGEVVRIRIVDHSEDAFIRFDDFYMFNK